MNEVNFYRGLKSKYSKDLYVDGLYFTTDTKEIILNGVSYGTVEVDDKLLETGNNPVIGSAIYKAIKDTISNSIKTAPFGASLRVINTGNNIYQIALVDAQGNILNDLNNSTIIGDLSGSVDMSGLSFVLLNEQNLLIKSGQKAEFKFTFDVRDASGASLGLPGKITIYKGKVSDGIILDEMDVEPGLVNIDVSQYGLEEGIKTEFNIVASTVIDGETKTSTKYVTVRLVNLNLALSGYSINNYVIQGNNLNIGYRISGINGTKSIVLYVDGVAKDTQTATSSDEVKGFSVSTEGLSHGTHNFQLLAEYKISETESVFSNLLYIDVPIIGSESIPAFGCVFDMEGQTGPLINTLPRLKVKQYNLFSLEYFVYNNETNRSVDFYSQEQLIGNYVLTDNSVNLTYKYSSVGSKLCSLICNNTTYLFYIDVVDSGYEVTEPTSNMILYLDALGKSNTSSNRDSWNYNNITSTFEGFKWGGDGWSDIILEKSTEAGIPDKTEAGLRLISGDKVTINYKPLERTTQSKNAFACTFKFRVTNAINESEELISCMDSDGTGFVIRANEAIFNTKEDKTVSTKFAAGEVYNIGFVSFPDTSYDAVNSNRLYLYVNGIICGTVERPTTDSIYQEIPTNITIKADNCTLDLFSVRIYNQLLTDEQMFDAYLIDLNNADLLASEYTLNDVLDFNGNVSVEGALKCGIPYMIITGQYGTLNAVDHVAAINDKDPKYDIDQILYIEGEESPRNFVVVKGEKNPQLRLQGTSSMKYARKNYRIYSKSAALTLGCDKNGEGGILQDSPKWSISDTAAPVNCWCLKADFAESSSSHNTGFANLVQDLLTHSDVNSLTPPQKYKNSSYEYEVRSTIEGHPCLLFARKTLTDTPVFVGKFNFNNDKSTEDVFGFLDINGYHKDSDYVEAMKEAARNSLEFPEDFTSVTVEDKVYDKEAIIAKLEENPTECWEFCNNENLFGQFKGINFDEKVTETKEETDPTTGETILVDSSYYKWIDCWEARFPDEDVINAAFEAGVKPKYLRLIAEWLMSTDTTIATNSALEKSITYGSVTYTLDTESYRRAKFAAEVSDYFNLTFLCDYYTLNDAVAGADQRVKNMMWAFWYDPEVNDTDNGMGKMRCYPIYYDNDTILGVDNSGAITINWDADENTKYPNGSYVFAGHDSVVWKNLRDCFASELKASYRKLRNIMSNDYMKKYFNTMQSEVYGEVVFNKDTLYKYVTPTAIGTYKYNDSGTPELSTWEDQASFVHGSRKAHRDWFIGKRMGWFDNKFATSTFVSNQIEWKGPLSKLPTMTLTSDTDYYYAVSSDSVGIDTTHKKVNAGNTFSFTPTAIPGPGAVFHLYGISQMRELDLSRWGGYTTISFGNCNALEKLILGGPEADPIVQSDIEIGTKMPFLKYLDITNTVGGASDGTGAKFTNLDVSGCMQLETLIANLCPNLRTINFAEGCLIKDITLPTGYENLYLRSLPNISNSGIKYESDGSTIKELIVDNCPNIDSIALLNSIMDLENSSLTRVRITGLQLEGNGSELKKFYNKIKGIDSTGTPVNQCKLIGTYKLTSLWVDDELGIKFEDLCAYFDELDIQQPEYTIISFDLANATPLKITNLDNSTGFKFGNTYKVSGHIKKILEQRHSYMVKNTETAGEFNVMQLSDADSNLYIDNNASALNGTEGDYCMYEPHYWYKGINDHINRVMYVLFSSNKECPKQAKGKKITLSDCTIRKNYLASASNLVTSESQILIGNEAYKVCEYILPDNHNYKQFRVSSVAFSSIGCVVVDSNGLVLLRLSADNNKGMHSESYLFSALPTNAYKIYTTLEANAAPEYCMYFTESMDIEALEPDWVEHKECFVGRMLSTINNNSVMSALYLDLEGGYYPLSLNPTVSNVCSMIENRGKGYYAADYEIFKDMIVLAYAKYGSTDLHISHVGASALEDGTYITSVSMYVPNGIDYTKYGILDTKTSGNYNSYYEQSPANAYPGVSTLLGYHQIIGAGSLMSNKDLVNNSTNIYSNSRTGRSFKIYSGSWKCNLHILGGRYVDIFSNGASGGTSSTGFCGEETSNSTSGTGFMEIGYVSRRTGLTPTTYCFTISANLNSVQTIGFTLLARLQRILIIPDKINFIEDSNTFKSL